MDDKTPAAGVLSLAAATKPSELEKALAMVERQWPQEVQIATVVAKSMRLKFNALKKEGFTDAQALHAACRWMWPSGN